VRGLAVYIFIVAVDSEVDIGLCPLWNYIYTESKHCTVGLAFRGGVSAK